MSKTLLSSILYERGALAGGVLLLVAVMFSGGSQLTARVLWLPALLLALRGTAYCVLGTIGGGYGLLAWAIFWPYSFVLLAVFTRLKPKWDRYSLTICIVMTFAIGLAAALIPQPGGKYYTLRFVDERGLAYGKTEVSYSIFGGDGPNRIGAAQTSSDGSLPIILYGYEWGHLGLSGGKEDVLFEPFSEEGVSGIRVSHDGLQRFLKHKSKDVIEIHRTDKPQ